SLGSWELIIVDDGSTDGTRDVVEQLIPAISQPARYIYQENRGAYGARNAGLALARGTYVAFYDSDDLWLPHHLADCVSVLAACREVDWAFGSSKQVDAATGHVLSENVFYLDGQPRPFLRRPWRTVGAARVLEGPGVLELVLGTGGLFAGLQCSVIRRGVFVG